MQTRLGMSSLLLAVVASAQTQVVPASLATTAGPSSTAWPFGLGSACRVQNFYHATETGFAGPVLIRSLQVRGNEGAINPAKANIDLQIELSTSPVNVTNASPTFASNRGSNHQVVYPRALTNIAATTGTNPGGYGGMWMFNAPFVYDPAQGNLLIEYDVASQPAGAWTLDTTGTAAAGSHSTVGTGCNGLNATSSGGGLGLTVTWTMTGGQPNGVALLLNGFNLFPAPIPVPGNPACSIYNSFPILTVVNLNSAGGATFNLPVPQAANLRGLSVFGQYAAINATLNIDTTQSAHVVLGGFLSGRIYNTSSNTTPTGSVQVRSAVVVELGI